MEYIEFSNRLCMLAKRAEEHGQTAQDLISEMLYQAELYREKWNELEQKAIKDSYRWNKIYG